MLSRIAMASAFVLGMAAPALADSAGGLIGTQKWTFSAPDHYFDYLADTETVTLTYTVQVDDHHGGVTSQDVAVTVNGTNDVPVVAVTDVTGALSFL